MREVYLVGREKRGHGFGKLAIEITDGRIVDIIREVRTKTRLNSTTR